MTALWALPALTSDGSWYVGAAVNAVSIDRGTTRFRKPAEEGLFGDPAQEFRFDSDIDDDTAFSLLGGWDSPSYGIRTELEYREIESDINDFGTDQSGQVFTGDAEAKQLIIMAWYDIHDIDFIPEAVVPYLGFGVGATNLELEGEKDTGVLAQFGAGVSYRFFDAFVFDIGYRYFQTEPLAYEPPEGKVTTKYMGDMITLGLRWYFTDGE